MIGVGTKRISSSLVKATDEVMCLSSLFDQRLNADLV